MTPDITENQKQYIASIDLLTDKQRTQRLNILLFLGLTIYCLKTIQHLHFFRLSQAWMH